MELQAKQTRWIALLAATGLALYLCWLMIRPFVGVLLWAVVLVIVFYPAHKWLVAHLGRPRLCALLSSTLVTVAILLPLSLVIAALAGEITKAAHDLPSQAISLLDPQASGTGRIVRWLEQYVNIQALRSPQFFVDQIKNMGSGIIEKSLGLVGGAIGLVIKSFFVIFTMYYLFRDGEQIIASLPGVLPLRTEQSKQIFQRTHRVINASVHGVVAIAMLQGMLGGLAFWLLGLPSPLLWAVIMTFICMIPVAGSFLVWLPASLYLAMTGHWTRGLILALWGLLVISTIDNFLRPKLMRGKTKPPITEKKT